MASIYSDKPQGPADSGLSVSKAPPHRRRPRRSWLIMKSMTPEVSSDVEVEGRWSRSAKLGFVLGVGGLFWLVVALSIWWFVH
jgi:hypothetical protein